MKEKYDSMILGGGGLKGNCMLGFLHRIYNLVEECKNYSGTSVGSLICTLLSCGWKPMDILVKTQTDPFINIGDISGGIGMFIKNFGFFDISTTLKPVREMIKEKLGDEDITFEEHFLITGKFLQITGTNVQKGCPVIFNHITYPNMSIVKAVEISCNIPLIFKKIIFEGCEYVDGELTSKLTPDNILERTKGRCLVLINRTPKSFVVNMDENILNYISRVIFTPLKSMNRQLETKLRKNEIVDVYDIIAPGWLKVIDNLSPSQKMELFKCGYEWGNFYASKEDYSDGIAVIDQSSPEPPEMFEY
jgi:predicted acylesterase/phospholipase RssA